MPVVNADKGAAKVELAPPNPYGYILVTAEIEPGSVTTDITAAEQVPLAADITSSSEKRAALHRTLTELREPVTAVEGVRSLSVFEAVLFAPSSLEKYEPRGSAGRPARFDSLLVIETDSPQASESVVRQQGFTDLMRTLSESGTYADYLLTENVKKIDDVDRDRDGVFLFNFFFSEAPEELLDIWDHTAGWWLEYGKMMNSELLRPTSACDYALINSARWEETAPAADAFRHPSYWEFVLANIDAHGATAMPSLYRRVV
ncbi:hypothetical protein ACFRAO_23630 [Streptomyces sp. NPDC056656]|uniref:hypothetical protein n=1 Tax=Streptomyces sp. NPDC056656 TaxID=3345895 RepID=UPI003678404B